ncbi:UbiX family flavin prenyltransferase [Lewinella sp. JB7]|uniref:UbiX family flavin prenyltransferase n=1 Tax=Lewinella sp. JB7 TaxID=2962887 RepID=UPI0020C94BA4|nr:UbiX family flavin prenyltransferase [Lewinella sp. JB7]MCP9235142.1 UbiX family flavin prenyltransferase [Lewinella sp. JB7]
MSNKKLVVAVGGSSGSLYAKVLFDRLKALKSNWENVGVVITDNGKFNWKLELGDNGWQQYPFDYYAQRDFSAPFASGSARYGTMIVCPCSMGLLARIATGVSNDLITRAADVILKERRRLILVPREAPYSLIHLRNMTAVTEAGGIICPAVPSFYSGATTAEEIVGTIVDRVLDLAGFELNDTYRWGETV